MSKPGGAHEVVKQAAAPEPGKSPSLAQLAIQVFTAVSLFLVVMTPIIYCIGRAYHDGWYSELNLDGSLFPLDTASMLTQGFMVAAGGLAKLALATLHALAVHFFLLLCVAVTAGMTLAGCRWMGHRLDEKVAGKPKRSDQDQRAWQRSPRFLIISSFLVVLLALCACYEAIFGLSLVAALFTQPFYQLGREDAAQLVAKGFNLSPMVTVKSPNGVVQRREITCGPAFCALWGEGHASQAPIAMVGWADAPSPGK